MTDRLSVGLKVAACERIVQAARELVIERVDSTALAHIILALLHEAATMMLTASDPLAERTRVGTTVATVMTDCKSGNATNKPRMNWCSPTGSNNKTPNSL